MYSSFCRCVQLRHFWLVSSSLESVFPGYIFIDTHPSPSLGGSQYEQWDCDSKINIIATTTTGYLLHDGGIENEFVLLLPPLQDEYPVGVPLFKCPLSLSTVFKVSTKFHLKSKSFFTNTCLQQTSNNGQFGFQKSLKPLLNEDFCGQISQFKVERLWFNASLMRLVS